MNSDVQRCWICNAPADSAEHRIKKADLVRAYGKGPYGGPSAPVHVRSGVLSQVQGPGSSRVKYDAYLCHACNTAGTQPFDNAYDRAIEWVMANEPDILRRRFLNFEEIYGPSYAEAQRNLFKYFVKSFGCRLVEAGQNVPQDLIDLLPLATFRTALKITFSVNEDVLLFHKQDRDGFIGKSGVGCWMSKTDPSVINGYFYNEHVSWFTVYFWYGSEPEGGLGSAWIANSQYVYLGSTTPLSSEERAEFIAKRNDRRLGD
jgi:hypothetical protein